MPRRYSHDSLVRRAYTADFRAEKTEDGTAVITGTPIVFDSPTEMMDGEYLEVIDRGALDGANLDDVRLFVNHDFQNIALARTKRGKGTMAIEVDDEGMHIKAVLDVEHNAQARSLYSSIERGDMDGMSFCFRIKSHEWQDVDSRQPTLHINEISIVHEVSVVNFPAYPQTTVSARSRTEENVMLKTLEEARAARKAEARKTEDRLLMIEKLRNANALKF